MTRLIYQANLRFWSLEKNGYCNSDSEVIDLPVRLMDLMDNAVPSVNGAAALLLERLFLVTGDKSYNRNYDQLIRTAGGVSNRNYTGIISFMSAYLECQVGFRIIAMFPDKSKDIPALLSEMRRLFLPGKMIIPVPDPEAISSIIQEVKAYPQQPALYICGNGQCYPPVTSKIEFELWKKNVIAHLK